MNHTLLSQLRPGQIATIHSINSTNPMYRRFLDLGFLSGTSIECVGISPAKDPISFLIRGTIIALRIKDCNDITVYDILSKEYTIALAGNPNVGKSTLFNSLTGLNQHTGNWPGKTVSNAIGSFYSSKYKYRLVDLPGTYSLLAHSLEEEIARDYICYNSPSVVIVVCDSTALERNLNLAIQIIETGRPVILCLNLMDEANKKGIKINIGELSELLHVPVIATIAKRKHSLQELFNTLDEIITRSNTLSPTVPITYSTSIESKLLDMTIHIENFLSEYLIPAPSSRWVALQILASDEYIQTEITATILNKTEDIAKQVTLTTHSFHNILDRKLDAIFTSKYTGYPIMLGLLFFIFWLTITGANYPSSFLAAYLFRFEDILTDTCTLLNIPAWIHNPFILGVYRVLAWVISVMLPPMAIFFPLFTLLEDSGYLPRIAYNLDKPFQKCNACGKQALCMCMGFGCNAVGVESSRIIDSPRERLLAILTNSLVPCNGRFPTLVAILSMFIIGTTDTALTSLYSAFLLTGLILLSILMTFICTKVLSTTLLKGYASSFSLELPSYRVPQIHKVFIRSIFDRTLFVLGRAIVVAAPAGLFIWIIANITIQDVSILSHCANFLDPFAQYMGLDGIILLAFILGFPANEIVLPIMVMGYLSEGTLTELTDLSQMRTLFIDNGWTTITALCVMIFSLFHWPCSTTILTIKKETNSLKWSLLSVLIPTMIGTTLCIMIATLSTLCK